MFSKKLKSYHVEETSMEEFLAALNSQKKKSSIYQKSYVGALEKKFLEAFGTKAFS
ncbi:hypothetical protein [Pleionea sediminis]|uniref:hypothetical protein n=1 Tax=Pleionea sediminis TaxID=2569479 RepID=UPI0013DE70BF|nr:hypothetical protein [Pleionea sediminis]